MDLIFGDTLSPLSSNVATVGVVQAMAPGSDKNILLGSCCLGSYIDSCLDLTARKYRSADENDLPSITPTGDVNAEEYLTVAGLLRVSFELHKSKERLALELPISNLGLRWVPEMSLVP